MQKSSIPYRTNVACCLAVAAFCSSCVSGWGDEESVLKSGAWKDTEFRKIAQGPADSSIAIVASSARAGKSWKVEVLLSSEVEKSWMAYTDAKDRKRSKIGRPEQFVLLDLIAPIVKSPLPEKDPYAPDLDGVHYYAMIEAKGRRMFFERHGIDAFKSETVEDVEKWMEGNAEPNRRSRNALEERLSSLVYYFVGRFRFDWKRGQAEGTDTPPPNK